MKKSPPSFDKLMEAARVIAHVDPHAALVGGVAMQVFGSRRLTGDLDVLVHQVPLEAAITLGRPLSFGGAKAVIVGVPTDFIVREDEAALLYQDAHAAALRIQGVPLRVVPPEWLVLLKLYASRPKDHLDIATIFGWKNVDRAKIAKLARRYLGIMAVKDLEQMAALADWNRNRPGAADEDDE